MNKAALLPPLMAAASLAGEKIMQVYAKNPQADFKGDGSPVTEADQAAEAIILPVLAEQAPQIPVVSEENASSHALAATQQFFLVDPLDGTREFLKRDGKGAFTVNIALVENGVPVLGVVYAPALDRMFSGLIGQGSHECMQGVSREIQARTVSQAERIAVASASHRDEQTNQWLADQAIKNTISIGSSLKFCLLACGEADVYPRFGPTMEWDTAAGDAVLRAAGGRVTTPQGALFMYGKPDYRNGAFVAWGG